VRRLVQAVLKDKGLSQRRSCELSGLSRTAVRYQPSDNNELLLKRIKELAFEHIRYGYRHIWALLRREGWLVNKKRVWRLWKKNGLQVPRRLPRQRKQGMGVNVFPVRALAPNHIWTLDFVADRLSHGGRLRMLSVLDEFTRECLTVQVERSLKAKDVQEALEKVIKERGAPCYLRSDNGSEFVEKNLQKWLRQNNVDSIFITPGSPWENGFCESFNGKLRDECLNMHWFKTLREAKVLIEMWRKEYNTFRPHRALRYKTPAEFAAHWNATHPSDSLPIVV
jgi:putative transposase